MQYNPPLSPRKLWTVLAAAVVATTALAVLPFADAGKPGSDPVDPAVLAGFEAVRDGFGPAVFDHEWGHGMEAKLDASEKKYRNGQLCAAHNILGAFMEQAQALRQEEGGAHVPVADALFAAAHALADSLFDAFLADPTLAAPEPCFDAAAHAAPQVQVLASDNTQFSAQVSFGMPSFETVEAAGQTWTQLSVPGLDPNVGAPGQPGIPSWQGLVAIPHGAEVRFDVQAAPGMSLALNLFPSQEQAADQAAGQEPVGDEEYPPRDTWDEVFADPAFVADDETYAMDAFYPPNPCAFLAIGNIRDVQVGQVQCMAGQYNPVSDELVVFDSVLFDVMFEGGHGNFVTTQTLSPFEPASSSAVGSTVNAAALSQYVLDLDLIGRICLGEQHLILTHPEFRAAADDLEDWKDAKGISSTVLEVGTDTPFPTGAAIDQLIEDRYDDCVVRPSYVTLIGDSEWVPPARMDYDTSGDSTTGSDWGYAIYPLGIFDILPDFGVARIPVDTAEEAQVVVDKIITYESDPPFLGFGSGGPFYTTASVAAQFQCCRANGDGSPFGFAGRDQRSFVETAETARNAMLAAGRSVERIYTETVASGYTGDATPDRYWSGDLLPADLRSGFAWDGDTNDIVNAFNAGRFNILHRDHGSSSGFVNPSFTTGNFGSLSNGELLPVVYSVNCASGYWDRETDTGAAIESFMEQLLLLPNGGMVGGIGDNRNSPTWANSAITRGFYDATWPHLAPEFGFGDPVKHRLGDILNHGRVYLLTQIGAAQPAGSVSVRAAVSDIIMYHAFGDATMEMWTANPHQIILPPFFEWTFEGPEIFVQYGFEGAELTAYQQTEEGLFAYGKAIVQEGGARISPYYEAAAPQHPPGPSNILLAASFPNAVSMPLHAPGQPDLVIRSMDLGASSAVAPGEDLSSRLAMTIGNLGDAGAPGTVKPDGTIQDGYMVDVVLSRDADMPFGFADVPQPAGDAWVEDGLLLAGRVSRTPDLAPGAFRDLPIGPPISTDVGGVIPTQAPQQEMFLCARIDPGDGVVESDETNNVLCIPVLVQAPVP